MARKAIFEGLYAQHISQEPTAKILDDILHRYEFDDDTKQFIEFLLLKTSEFNQSIVEIISKYLENWEWGRVALLDRLVLQMGTAELLYVDDVPPKVTIAEAITIAKHYSTDDSSAFVNGVLDAIYKSEKSISKDV